MIDSIEVKQFTMEIEKIVETKELNYIDAIVHYCEEKDIDVESVVPFVNYNHQLKSKLYDIASELRFVKRVARLPI